MTYRQLWQITAVGLALAVAAFALEWLEYRYVIRTIPSPIYILILVTGFTAFGIWTGHRLSRPARQKTFELNKKALEALSITGREMAVLEQLATGQSNKEIARVLGISPNTVKTHVKNIYEKLKVRGRMQAVSVARELRLLPS